MIFEHAEVLMLGPAAVLAVWWTFRRPRALRTAERSEHIRRRWADARGLSDPPARIRRGTRGALLALGLLCALVALARPQWGAVEEVTFDQAREVLLALDLSRSMTADDVPPTRLVRARLLIESLLDQLRGERVGLIVFAGTGFLQSPLSADTEVLRDLLPELEPDYLPQGGTDYSAVLRAALEAFDRQRSADRFLVILSDGEAHDEGWRDLVPKLQAAGVQVIGLGIGTPEGALLTDAAGGIVKDERGAAVLSRLEPATLQQLAEETGGLYADAASWVDIGKLVDASVGRGFEGEFSEAKGVRMQERFQWLLGPALALLLLAWWRELPVSPVARHLPQRSAPPQRLAARDAARAGAAGIALAALLAAKPGAGAQDEAGPPANPLETTVAELVAKPAVEAADYARLAQQTIGFASSPQAAGGGARAGILDDALAGVDRGERLDPQAADWPALREQLERLREQQSRQQQQQEQEQQQQQEQEQSDQQEQQEQQGQQQEAGGDGQPQSGDSQDSPAGERAGDPEANDEPQDPESQSAGGDDPPDASERAESGQPRELDASEAGLGDLDETEPPEPAEAETAARDEPPSKKRLVGGGDARPSKLAEEYPELAGALNRMERVRNQDAPAVLFQRMNESENEPQPERKGKDW